MNCRELSEFLSDYVTGELPQEVRVAFEGHVGCCPDCHAYLVQYRTTVQLTAHAFDDPIPEPMPEELVRAIVAALRTVDR